MGTIAPFFTKLTHFENFKHDFLKTRFLEKCCYCTQRLNYRPLSQISPISKVYENVMCKQINHFFNTNKLMYEHQYGFREGLNTQSAIIKCHDHLQKNMKQYNAVIAVDLKKAFDSVNHNLLKFKLRKYGFSGPAMSCLSSYLNGREQYVQIKSGDTVYKSKIIDVLGGVPQGSVIGSTLFLIFINDAPQYIKLMAMKVVLSKFLTLLFADDLLIVITSKSIEQLEIDAYILLSIIYQWAGMNFQEANVDKTKLILISTKNLTRNFRLLMNDTEIERVVTLKYLGMLLDERMNFNCHVVELCKKLHSALFILRILSKYCDTRLLLLVYHALIIQRIDYCITSWSVTKTKNLDRVFLIKKKALRIILKLNYTESCKDHFVHHQLLTVPSIVIYRLVVNFLKKGTKPATHISNIKFNTRNANTSIIIKDSHCIKRGHSFFLQLPVNLRNEAKNGSNRFKRLLKEYLINRALYSLNELQINSL